MRKDVTLGMSIGGVLLAVVIVIISVSGHNKNSRHPVETGPVADSSGEQATPPVTTDTSPTADSTAKTETPPTTAPLAPQAAQPKTDDKDIAAKVPIEVTPATSPSNATASANTDDKQDPVWGGKLWNNTPTPLLGVTAAPDPNAATAEKLDQEMHNQPQTTVDASKKIDPAALTQVNVQNNESPATSRPSEAMHTHTVQKGETFSTIAASAYGSANFYPYIMRANPTVDAKALRPGMVIKIPDVSIVKPAESTEKPAQTPVNNTKAKPTVATDINSSQYIVQSGDSLNRIAVKKYGKVDMVSRIYEMNKQTIGDDPAKLKVGMVLTMPPAPVASAH